jgi:hypothetical protein
VSGGWKDALGGKKEPRMPWRGSFSGGGGVQIVSTQPPASCKGKGTRPSTTGIANQSGTSVLEGGLTACLGKLRDCVYVRVS